MTSTDDHLEIILKDMMIKSQTTVMSVGQTANCLTYNRKVTAFTAVMGDKWKCRVEATITEQSQLLERTDSDLFGTGFPKHIAERAKAKKESTDA